MASGREELLLGLVLAQKMTDGQMVHPSMVANKRYSGVADFVSH